MTLREIEDRYGVSRSALSRHRRHKRDRRTGVGSLSIDRTRTSNGRWRRGHSDNPEGRRAETDPERRRVRELARECTEEAVEALREIMLDSSMQGMARVQAAKELIARGWGTATDEATLDALGRGRDEVDVIRFVMPMSLDEEIEGELIDDDEPPALPPAAS